MSKAEQRNVTLVRGLGLVAAASIVIGNVIGTGVFLKARVMTCNVGTPGMVITVWVVAGLLALAGALTYAELTTMMPRAGGEYVFMREAYGRRALRHLLHAAPLRLRHPLRAPATRRPRNARVYDSDQLRRGLA